MRKAELRLQAERGTSSRGNSTIIIYKAMQWRWEFGQTADPQIDDISYHLTLNEAISAANSITLELGFQAQVDRIAIAYSDMNEGINLGENFELADLYNYSKFYGEVEIIYEGVINEGDLLNPGAVVVMYRHHRYMNYAYSIERVCRVWETNLKTTSDLRDDSDSLSTTYCIVLANLDELAEAFRLGNLAPFNKINSGSRIVREFLTENGHPDYAEVEDSDEVR